MAIIFVSGNAGKTKEIQDILGEDNVIGRKIDLKEIQAAKPADVIREKLIEAIKIIGEENCPDGILVEDTGLSLGAFSPHIRLPGPSSTQSENPGYPAHYIKDYIKIMSEDGPESHGLEMIHKMCSYSHKGGNLLGLRAKATTYIGFQIPNQDPIFTQGSLYGTVSYPRGTNGFGWDPIFAPDKDGKPNAKTLAEMTPEEKNTISMRKLAAQALAEKLGLKK